MLYFYLLIITTVLVNGEWYDGIIIWCAYVDAFVNLGGDGLNPQIYWCATGELLIKSTVSRSTCESYTDCYLDTEVLYPDVCMGRFCTWYEEDCYCREIPDPYSKSNGCDACKFETPSPTYEGECDCSNSIGFGLYDSNGDCQCDVELLNGDDCYGGTGSGSFDVRIIPFVPESCHWDSKMGLYRSLKCWTEDELIIELFVDDECAVPSAMHTIKNDTCYYDSFVKQSMRPTLAPTASPVDTESPTRGPTMTDAPTLPPIVIDTKTICNQTELFLTLNQTFYDVGDHQWIDDCEELLATQAQRLNIVCGCLGKFSKSMANIHLNCILVHPYHGVTIWNMCKNSYYSQSCGSTCTGWLRRRRLTEYEANQRRRSVAANTFKLTWSEDVCEGVTPPDWTVEPTEYPTELPTASPTKQPTLPPLCKNNLGVIPTSSDCMCGTAYCNSGEYCIAGNNECYNNPRCSHLDGEMIQLSTCVCGQSGVTCDIDVLDYTFLCHETATTPCQEIELCPNMDGTLENPNWCRCESEVSIDEVRACSSNQYCDGLNDWCSWNPTCQDTSGATPSSTECSCGSPLNTCAIGEYCKVKDFTTCSASANPTSTPTSRPTRRTSDPTNMPSDYPTTDEPTYLPTGSPTNRPTMSPTSDPSNIPSNYPTQLPTLILSASPSLSPTNLPTPRPTQTPTLVPVDELTYLPTGSPTNYPTTDEPTILPTGSPTIRPTTNPTSDPSFIPSNYPTQLPTLIPSASPSLSPTNLPTIDPTARPTQTPTSDQTDEPTILPTGSPTNPPTTSPTSDPSINPSNYPTQLPTLIPSESPSLSPTNLPTSGPSLSPTNLPTISKRRTRRPTKLRPASIPSQYPTQLPTITQSISPSVSPTNFPTSESPSLSPTNIPTSGPSLSPTNLPTIPKRSTRRPTTKPTLRPTSIPSQYPTQLPTITPSIPPSVPPTNFPTIVPSVTPTNQPTSLPSTLPTLSPTRFPTPSPTEQPTVCIPRVQVWDETTVSEALEQCVDGTGITVKDLSAFMCTGKEEYQDSLNLSLANRLWPECTSRCVNNINDKDQVFRWNKNNECWRIMWWGVCIESEDFAIMGDYIENKLCPDCEPYNEWSVTRADEICTADDESKSYGVALCPNSEGEQEKLEASLANHLFQDCSSVCVYDYDTLKNNILTGSTDYGGYFWKPAVSCWKWKTGGKCFGKFLDEFDEATILAENICGV